MGRSPTLRFVGYMKTVCSKSWWPKWRECNQFVGIWLWWKGGCIGWTGISSPQDLRCYFVSQPVVLYVFQRTNEPEKCAKVRFESIAGWWFGTMEFYNFMTFHILGIIIPIDFHIFQRGWAQPPTRKTKLGGWTSSLWSLYRSVDRYRWDFF